MNRLLATGIVFSLNLSALCGATAQQREPAGIYVTGECLKKITQDRGAVLIGTSNQAPTAQQAAERTIKDHEKMRADITQLGLKDLTAQTESYSVTQDCSFDGTKNTCSGYRATLSTRFESSEIAKIGEIIAVASRHGSQEVSQLQTFVSSELLKSEREACLEVATKNAAAKAQKLAAGAGVRLGKLLSVQEGGPEGNVGPLQPLRQQRSFATAEVGALSQSTPSIESKPEELHVVVRATYAIE
jgi:uncharacterized protein YggE